MRFAIVVTIIILVVLGLTAFLAKEFNQARLEQKQHPKTAISGNYTWTLLSDVVLNGDGYQYFLAPDGHEYISKYSGGVTHAEGCSFCRKFTQLK